MPELFLPLLLLLLFIGAIAGSAAGFGLFIIVGPLLWIFWTPSEAIAFGFSAGWGITGFVLARHYKSIDWALARKVLLWSLPGLLGGIALHLLLGRSILLFLGAGIIILAIAFRYRRGQLPPPLGGGLAGVLTTSVGFNGPPVALAMHGRAEEAQRSTMVFILLLLSLLGLPAMVLSPLPASEIWRAWLLGVAALPIVIFGAWLGDRLASRMGRGIELLALLISISGAGSLLLAGLGVI